MGENTLTRLKNTSTGTTVYYDPCSMNTCWWSSYRQQQTTAMVVDGQWLFPTILPFQTTGEMLPQVKLSSLSCRLPGVGSATDIATTPTAKRRLFTGTWVCLLMHRRPRKLWRSRSSLMGSRRTKQLSKTVSSAQQLLDFFNAKGNAVQTTLGQTLAVWEVWRVFCRWLGKTINTSQSKTCEQDPITSDILKQFLQELFAYITGICKHHFRLLISITASGYSQSTVSPRLIKAAWTKQMCQVTHQSPI